MKALRKKALRKKALRKKALRKKAVRWIYAIFLVASVVTLGYFCAEADERDIANASLNASSTDSAQLAESDGVSTEKISTTEESSSTDAAEIEEFDNAGTVISFGRFLQTDYNKEEYLKWVAVAKDDDMVLLVFENVFSTAVYSEVQDDLKWSTSKLREYLNELYNVNERI